MCKHFNYVSVAGCDGDSQIMPETNIPLVFIPVVGLISWLVYIYSFTPASIAIGAVMLLGCAGIHFDRQRKEHALISAVTTWIETVQGEGRWSTDLKGRNCVTLADMYRLTEIHIKHCVVSRLEPVMWVLCWLLVVLCTASTIKGPLL